MLSSSTRQYINDLIGEMMKLSDGEHKNARILLSNEISRVLDDLQKNEHRHSFHNSFFTTPQSVNSGHNHSSSSSMRDMFSPLYGPSSFVTPIRGSKLSSANNGDWLDKETDSSAVDEAEVVLQTKIYIPEAPSKLGGRNVKCNYIGRILGPSGMSARAIERQFGVTLLVRGAGSIRPAEVENMLKGKKGYEHLDEQLHVLLVARHHDKSKCQETLDKAAEKVESLLTPVHDEYKMEQLVHFAIMNGTYEERKKGGRQSWSATKSCYSPMKLH